MNAEEKNKLNNENKINFSEKIRNEYDEFKAKIEEEKKKGRN